MSKLYLFFFRFNEPTIAAGQEIMRIKVPFDPEVHPMMGAFPYNPAASPEWTKGEQFMMVFLMDQDGHFVPAQVESMDEDAGAWSNTRQFAGGNPGRVTDIRTLCDLREKKPYIASAYDSRWVEEYQTMVHTNRLLHIVPSLENLMMLKPVEFLGPSGLILPQLNFVVHRRWSDDYQNDMRIEITSTQFNGFMVTYPTFHVAGSRTEHDDIEHVVHCSVGVDKFEISDDQVTEIMCVSCNFRKGPFRGQIMSLPAGGSLLRTVANYEFMIDWRNNMKIGHEVRYADKDLNASAFLKLRKPLEIYYDRLRDMREGHYTAKDLGLVHPPLHIDQDIMDALYVILQDPDISK